MYFHDGRPVPFDARHKLKAAVADLKTAAGFDYVAGLEIEFYVTRVLDPKLGRRAHGHAWGRLRPRLRWRRSGAAIPISRKSIADRIDDLLNTLADHCVALGLPLRTMEDEMGPGQLEFTFDVQPALETADTHDAVPLDGQTSLRAHGVARHLHDADPDLPNFFSSGWHLHQSLSGPSTVKNVFRLRTGVGRAALRRLGAISSADCWRTRSEASVFTTPTVNGYKRRRPNSLAPDRATWGYDNRAAMIRVQGAPGDPTTHIENRIGEPTANPYLYIASQIVSGLDGRASGPLIRDRLRKTLTRRPTVRCCRVNLMQALDVLEGKRTFFKDGVRTRVRRLVGRHETGRGQSVSGGRARMGKKSRTW